MRIEVRLCNTLAECRRGGAAFAVTLPDGTTVDEALRRMSLRRSRLETVLCNGESVRGADGGSRRLRDGDHLVISAHDSGAVASRPGRACAALMHGLRRLSALLSPRVQTR